MGGLRKAMASGGLRPWLLFVLLAAILLRAATPPGWMPDPQGALGAPLVICTGDGSHLVQFDRDGQPAKPQPRSAQRHDLCAFAGHQAAPAPQIAWVSGPASFVAFAPAGLAAQAAPARLPRHREQAPRAPPTLV
jgi:hypothetical protein